jgi:hypothetical protein
MQPFPVIERRFQKRLDDDRAGMVEQHGGRSKRPFDGGNRSNDLGLLRDVGNKKLGNTALPANVGHGFCGGIAVSVDDRHLGTLGGKQPRGGAAHPRRTTGDDRHLALQSVRHPAAPYRLHPVPPR